MTKTDDYSRFVTHPRYGRRPRITGLNPEPGEGESVFLHWHSPPGSRIPDTAIAADLSRQSPATVPVTHYFDARRECRDCGRPFIFFAEEQKYWYEELGFPLESDCVRCVDCRKRRHGLDRRRERYEELFHASDRSVEQDLEMAECSLSLVESGIFHERQLQRVRVILKALPPDVSPEVRAAAADLLQRLEARKSDSGDAA